jgi:RNA polymerase sigma factor (TIGR02999 family)
VYSLHSGSHGHTLGGDTLQANEDEITALLRDLRKGNRTVMGELMPLVYDELRRIARRYLAGQDEGHTLSPTALVNESYLKLVKQPSGSWQDRAHFLSVAAVAMRQILVNHARARNAQKRDGGIMLRTFDDSRAGSSDMRSDELIALDDALCRLDAASPRQRAVIEYRFFGGLTHEEIAEVLGVSVPTVRRDWRIARAWLVRELSGPDS